MSNKKIMWVRTLKLLALIVPVIVFVLFIPCNGSEDTRRIHDFYLEEPYSLDVVVMGASDIYAGYSPMLAYEEYGFTSYPYVLSGNYIHLFPAQLEQIHLVQSPKLIVIEITETLKEWNDYDVVFRQYIAGVPMSKHKVKMIRELGESDAQLSYLLPFSVFHGTSNLDTLINNAKSEARVRNRGYSLLKGTWTFTGTGENWDGEYVTPISTANDYSKAEIPTAVADNYHKFLSYCRDNGYDNIVFVNYPQRRANQERYYKYQVANAVGELIESYGYDFINLESMIDEIGIQPETDFYNNDHMNLFGQYKVTRYLCNILVNEYGIDKTELSEQNKERWENCVEFSHRYYDLFEYEYRTRDPQEFGVFLKEEDWLFARMEDMEKAE